MGVLRRLAMWTISNIAASVLGAVLLTALAGSSVHVLFAGLARKMGTISESKILITIGSVGCVLSASLLFTLLRALNAAGLSRKENIVVPDASEDHVPSLATRLPTAESLPTHKPTDKASVDERHFVDVDVGELTGPFAQYTNVVANKLLDIYRGHWMRLSGRIQDVEESAFGNFMIVHLDIERSTMVQLHFALSWRPTVTTLKRSTAVTAER
jgi:hypothetical protein